MSDLVQYAIPAAAVVLAAVVPSWLAGRRSKDSTAASNRLKEGTLELDGRREDGAAFERASQINKDIIASLRAELALMRQTIRELRAELAGERRHSAALENHVRALESRARVMERLLDTAGVQSPSKIGA